jgi:hypothetical protein
MVIAGEIRRAGKGTVTVVYKQQPGIIQQVNWGA